MTGLAEDLRPTQKDPGEVEIAIQNLAITARDASPDEGKLTTKTRNMTLGEDDATTQPDVEPGPYVALRVCDTGKGMSEGVIARVRAFLHHHG